MTDKITLNNEEDYLNLKAAINAGKKPANILRIMLQAMENYRQSKKYGWSRPWNKYDTVTFQSFVLNHSDAGLRKIALELIQCEFLTIPQAAQEFVDDLLSSGNQLMGYVFMFEYNDKGQLYEGAVLSYGRICGTNRRFRDRLDIIVESPVVKGISKGLARIRVYADPYRDHERSPLWQSVNEQPQSLASFRLFNQLAESSWQWAGDKSRLWDHWIVDYIDYFGPRSGLVKQSFFHVEEPENRLLDVSNH